MRGKAWDENFNSSHGKMTSNLTYRFFDALRPPFRDPVLLGTFAPASRASERPMAIACLRLVTRLPERPLFSVPRLRSFIARSTFAPAFLPYLAMHTLPYASLRMLDPCRSGAVANRAPLCDIARHTANGEPRLIAQAFGKLHESMCVGEVADHAE